MSMENSHINKKFEEALQLLNDAAKDKKEEIQHLLGDKYTEIRELIEETASKQKKNFDQARRVAEDWMDDGGEKLREAVEGVDDKVRQDPWAYIGGAALGALLLGFILGSSSRNK